MQDCHQFSPVLLLAEILYLMENASDYEIIKGLGHEIDSIFGDMNVYRSRSK
jgi:hypothetical protein